MSLRLLIASFVLTATLGAEEPRAFDASPPADEAVRAEDSAGDLPYFDPFASDGYRTPRSGEGFRTELFGETIDVPPRDRRSLAAWDIGLAGGIPGADEANVLPFASIYLWENPGNGHFFRGIVVALYNELFYGYSPDAAQGFEAVVTWENLNVPVEQGELIDGIVDDSQKTNWGFFRPGVGFGYRRSVGPQQDNMLAVTWTFEPQFLYFSKGETAVNAYREPQDTFDLRSHFQVKLDMLERNLLELPHGKPGGGRGAAPDGSRDESDGGVGYAAGLDVIYGYRTNWEDWGIQGVERAAERRDYAFATAYVLGVAPVPGLASLAIADSERHRLVGSIHGGFGGDLDRFSAPRLGGGPQPFGEEYGSTSRPILPGAVIDAYTPSRYAVAVAEYRYEPIFFTYLAARASVGYLDRDRRRSRGIHREDDVLAAVGLRLTSGFVLNTRIQIDYNYNFGEVRRDGYGAHEIVFHISGMF